MSIIRHLLSTIGYPVVMTPPFRSRPTALLVASGLLIVVSLLGLFRPELNGNRSFFLFSMLVQIAWSLLLAAWGRKLGQPLVFWLGGAGAVLQVLALVIRLLR